MNHERATKQETGIISYGHAVWLFAEIFGHVIIILIESEKLKVYHEWLYFGLYSATQNKLKFILKKLYQKIHERRTLLKWLIFVIIYFLGLIHGACYMEVTKTQYVLNFNSDEIKSTKTNLNYLQIVPPFSWQNDQSSCTIISQVV